MLCSSKGCPPKTGLFRRGSETGPLTVREMEVLGVHTHVSHVLAKLKLSSRMQAASFALREGLAPLQGTDPSAATQ